MTDDSTAYGNQDPYRTAPAGPYDQPHISPYATAPADAPAPSPAPGANGDAGVDPAAYWRRPDGYGPDASPPSPAAQQTAPPPSSPPANGAGDSDGDVDFDAWWAQHTAEQPKVKMFGEWWPIPFDVPLWITNLVEQGDLDLRRLKTAVDALYGDGAADRFIGRGAGAQALGVVLAWSILRAQGQKVSFADAVAKAEELATKAAEQQGHTDETHRRLSEAAAGYHPDSPEARAAAAALEAHRDAGKAPWSASGGPSSPTSAGSTGSTAPPWQR